MPVAQDVMEERFYPTTALTLRPSKKTGKEVSKLTDGKHVYTFKRENMHGLLSYYCANSAHLEKGYCKAKIIVDRPWHEDDKGEL
jgi:hypothetical protein